MKNNDSENIQKRRFWMTIQNIASIVAMIAIVICGVSAVMYHNAWLESVSRLEKSMKENVDLKQQLASSTAEVESLRKQKAKPAGKEEKLVRTAQLMCGKEGTIARRFNNPCNVKRSVNGAKWKGQIGYDSQGHIHFVSVYHGIRAAAMTLRSYYTRHGIKTLNGIISRFCGGNPGYVKFLSSNMGLAPDEEFNVVDRIPELVWFMSQYESGKRLPGDCLVTLDLVKGTR